QIHQSRDGASASGSCEAHPGGSSPGVHDMLRQGPDGFGIDGAEKKDGPNSASTGSASIDCAPPDEKPSAPPDEYLGPGGTAPDQPGDSHIQQLGPGTGSHEHYTDPPRTVSA